MASSYAPFSTSVLYAVCSAFRAAVRAFVFAYARLFAALSRSMNELVLVIAVFFLRSAQPPISDVLTGG